MIKLLFIFLLFISYRVNAQQWDWAVTADSVYGNQHTVMLCKSNNAIYALINQDGPSVINNTHLDSGSVIVKISTGGQILWAKHYPGSLKSLYSENGGTIYFIGSFNDNLNFPDTTLVSHGGTDIFYGELDPSGNKLWVSSAGGTFDDVGNGIIHDSQGNLFFTGQIKDNYFVGNQTLSGKLSIYTYLLRCDLNGNYMASYGDSITNRNTGLQFQKDATGTIFLSTFHESYDCPYVCESNNIQKINPVDYTATTRFGFGIFEYLHSWVLINDSLITANYNTQSHYGNSYSLFNVSKSNIRTFRKGMGWMYDGKTTPYIVSGIGDEIIAGGTFFPLWGGTIDTLKFDNFAVVPDTLPSIMVSGIDLNNDYTWFLRSTGKSGSSMSSLVSDQQGHCYTAGSFNIHDNYYPYLPKPLILGNIILPAENTKGKFFVAGVSSMLSVDLRKEKELDVLSLFPNPVDDKLFVKLPQQSVKSTIRIYDITGCILKQNTIAIAGELYSIDVANFVSGVYIVEVLSGGKTLRAKFIIVK